MRVGHDEIVGALEVIEPINAAERPADGPARLECLASTADAGKLGDGLAVRGLDAGFSAQGVHRDHVGLVKGAQHLVAPHVIIACRADERVEHADGADGNREVAHAGCRERLHAHAQHLGIGDEARAPDELDAELRELPLLAIRGRALREDRLAIVEAKRARLIAQARRREARNGNGNVRAQDDEVAVAVKEAKRRLGARRELRGRVVETSGSVEHGGKFDGRRLDGQVAPKLEPGAHGVARRTSPSRLGGQHIAKTAWRLGNHRESFSFNRVSAHYNATRDTLPQ